MSPKFNFKKAVVVVTVFVAPLIAACNPDPFGGSPATNLATDGRKAEVQVLDAVGGCTGLLQAVCDPNR